MQPSGAGRGTATLVFRAGRQAYNVRFLMWPSFCGMWVYSRPLNPGLVKFRVDVPWAVVDLKGYWWPLIVDLQGHAAGRRRPR